MVNRCQYAFRKRAKRCIGMPRLSSNVMIDRFSNWGYLALLRRDFVPSTEEGAQAQSECHVP